MFFTPVFVPADTDGDSIVRTVLTNLDDVKQPKLLASVTANVIKHYEDKSNLISNLAHVYVKINHQPSQKDNCKDI